MAVREIQSKTGATAPFLSRPVSIVCDEESVYVLDAADADIKTYSKDGTFRGLIGRKGEGPAEFRLPNDMDVFGHRIYVADSANRRVQILDAAGKPLGGFRLEIAPWRILVLGADKILVAGLPSARSGGGKLIRCFRGDGTPAWQAVDGADSADSVLDAFKNQIFIERTRTGGFWLVRSFDDRMIRIMNADGFRTAEAAAPESELPFKEIVVPTAKRQTKTLRGFCWSAAADRGRLYLLSPEYTDDKDLGAGKAIAVFGETLEVEARITLPGKMTRFAVAGDTIYAIDADSQLRIFAIGRVADSTKKCDPTPRGQGRRSESRGTDAEGVEDS